MTQEPKPVREGPVEPLMLLVMGDGKATEPPVTLHTPERDVMLGGSLHNIVESVCEVS